MERLINRFFKDCKVFSAVDGNTIKAMLVVRNGEPEILIHSVGNSISWAFNNIGVVEDIFDIMWITDYPEKRLLLSKIREHLLSKIRIKYLNPNKLIFKYEPQSVHMSEAPWTIMTVNSAWFRLNFKNEKYTNHTFTL